MVTWCNSSNGGKISAKAGVKLAYKTVFALIFTSDGYPMLIVAACRSKKMSLA